MDRVIQKRKWTIRKIGLYIGLPFLTLASLSLIISSTGAKSYKASTDRIKIATVKKDRFQEFIAIPGEVLPQRTVFIDAIEGGQVKAVFLEGGESVNKGDLILQLSNPSLELSYMNLTTGLLEQLNNLRNSRITLEENGLNLMDQLLMVQNQIDNLSQEFARNEELFQDTAVSEAEFIESKNNYQYNLNREKLLKLRLRKDSLLKDQQLAQIESSMDMIQENLSIVKYNLSNLNIKAPVSGQMSSIRVEIGETVSPGQKLGQIDMLNGGYKIRAQIDEHYNGRVYKDQKGEFLFQGQAYALNIRKVYPEVTDGTFEVDLDFIGEIPEEIKRGQNLQIRLALSEEEEALVIPRGSFYHASAGQYIFVLNEEGTKAYRRNNLKIGRQSDRSYEILSGLEEGERVIISNYDSYKEINELILQDK